MFYTFYQNNSGGNFTGPAVYVIIEANSAKEANDRAEDIGLYFNGASEDENGWSRDCPCCGDRWTAQWSDADGTEKPEIYGKHPATYSDVAIYYANGVVV
jgi:hypothetical protein